MCFEMGHSSGCLCDGFRPTIKEVKMKEPCFWINGCSLKSGSKCVGKCKTMVTRKELEEQGLMPEKKLTYEEVKHASLR